MTSWHDGCKLKDVCPIGIWVNFIFAESHRFSIMRTLHIFAPSHIVTFKMDTVGEKSRLIDSDGFSGAPEPPSVSSFVGVDVGVVPF